MLRVYVFSFDASLRDRPRSPFLANFRLADNLALDHGDPTESCEAADVDDLQRLVEQHIGGIHGVGALTVSDITHSWARISEGHRCAWPLGRASASAT